MANLELLCCAQVSENGNPPKPSKAPCQRVLGDRVWLGTPGTGTGDPGGGWVILVDRLMAEIRIYTLEALKFNIAPEKWWLEDYFPIGKVTFQGLC